MQRQSMQTVLRLLWLIATAASLSRQPVRSVNLNNFIQHQTTEEEFASQRRADVEAAAARLRAEADAAAKLKIPKVALLFLTRGPMPHETAWAAWLAAARGMVPLEYMQPGACTWNATLEQPVGHVRPMQETLKLRRRIFVEQALFSVYVHPSPEFPGYPKDSVFYGKSVRLRVKVSWGSHSEVEAMRLLLRAALANTLNERFVYLCETAIPIYPPTVVYHQLMKETKSRIDACAKSDPEDPMHSIGRWEVGMLPVVPREMWRKSGQWITLNRKHADIIARDYSVASEFEEHCPHEANEHYFGVVLAVHGLEQETACASSAMSCVWPWEYGDLSHPVTFQADQITPELILERRQNKADWKKHPVCGDMDAIRSAAGAFVEVGPDWQVGCHWKPEAPYNETFLQGKDCSLFARKMSVHAKLQVEDVMTSCDERLQIAPRATCAEERKQGHSWIFG